jgi:hypothetical protein
MDVPPQKITVIKSSITGIGWKEQYTQSLKELVNNVNQIVTHTYLFRKFIFVNELDNTDDAFNLEEYINDDFLEKFSCPL